MTAWRLFVDDLADTDRDPAITVDSPSWRATMNMPETIGNRPELGEWVIARSCDEAVAHVGRLGMPTFVSFDHDLGDGKDAMWFVRWLVETDLDDGSLPPDFGYETHSANPVGRSNISGLLDAYLAQRNRYSP